MDKLVTFGVMLCMVMASLPGTMALVENLDAGIVSHSLDFFHHL